MRYVHAWPAVECVSSVKQVTYSHVAEDQIIIQDVINRSEATVSLTVFYYYTPVVQYGMHYNTSDSLGKLHSNNIFICIHVYGTMDVTLRHYMAKLINHAHAFCCSNQTILTQLLLLSSITLLSHYIHIVMFHRIIVFKHLQKFPKADTYTTSCCFNCTHISTYQCAVPW